MYDRLFFSKRFALLLQTYGLNYPEMAELLGLKQKNRIYDWAKGRGFPGDQNLYTISHIFAVSLDWLLGSVSQPYRLDLLTELEIESVAYLIDSLRICGGMAEMPTEYEKIELRGQYYTPGQRANLIFIALSSKYKALNQGESLKLPGLAADFLSEKSKQSLGLSIIENKNGWRDLLNRNIKTPLYDLEIAIKNA